MDKRIDNCILLDDHDIILMSIDHFLHFSKVLRIMWRRKFSEENTPKVVIYGRLELFPTFCCAGTHRFMETRTRRSSIP
jgi:hypothetical protein